MVTAARWILGLLLVGNGAGALTAVGVGAVGAVACFAAGGVVAGALFLVVNLLDGSLSAPRSDWQHHG